MTDPVAIARQALKLEADAAKRMFTDRERGKARQLMVELATAVVQAADKDESAEKEDASR